MTWPDDYVGKVIHGDCLSVMRNMPDKCVDLVLTDPPYGIGKAEWDDSFPTEWIPEAWRLTEKMLVMPGEWALIEYASAIGKYKGCVILHSRNGMTHGPLGFGNWIPVLACGEWKAGARQNHLSFNVETSERIDHPSPKPIAAMLRLIGTYTDPNDLILDPFCGSGTTLVAAKMLGRRFIGIDIEKKYCDIAEERLRNTTPPLPFVAERQEQCVLI